MNEKDEEWYVEPKKLIEQSIKWHDFQNNAAFVYFLIDNNVIVYVGQTVRIHSRLHTHTKDKKFNRVIWMQVPKRKKNQIETYYINLLRPKYNKSMGNGREINSPTVIYRFAQQKKIDSSVAKRFMDLRGCEINDFKKFYAWCKRKWFFMNGKGFGENEIQEYINANL